MTEGYEPVVRASNCDAASPRSNAARLHRILDRLDLAMCRVLRCPGDEAVVVIAAAISYHADVAVLVEHALPKADQLPAAVLARLVRGVWHHVRLAQAVSK